MTYINDTGKPLNATQFEVLKAVSRGQVVMHRGARGTWKYGHMTVSQTFRPLLERGLAVADTDFDARGRRGAHLTPAGLEELSRAHRIRLAEAAGRRARKKEGR